jgi:MarR family transcriptional regulator, lower aerobic nicotinate degradation pathway regulator
MDSVLRPHDLGATQWYVLYQLANDGPTMQRDLVQMLQIDRATLSGVVAALVRKGLIDQKPHPTDQRQKVLHITTSGEKLWQQLPDPIALILATAFDGVDDADQDTVVRVLQAATQRLNNHLKEGFKK